MKALLIDPEARSIEAIEVASREEIVGIIGYDTIEIDAVGDRGDRLFFDEECFLRGTKGRFQIDSIIPVAGKGVVVGSNEDGTRLSDVQTDIEELRSRTKFL
jgi:hypothetical protein